MVPLATSTFLQVIFGGLILLAVTVLWVAAIVGVMTEGGGGWRMAGLLLMIVFLPVLGPLLYFVFFRREEEATAEATYRAREDIRREAASRPIGGTDLRA